MRRVIIEYTPYGTEKSSYMAATVTGHTGDLVFLETMHGEHGFSRVDGRWIFGPCLNLEQGQIHQREALEIAIRSGQLSVEYEISPGAIAEKTIEAAGLRAIVPEGTVTQ